MLKITYPRILCVRRVDPLRFSVGDEAIVEFGAGLLSFLDLMGSDGRRLGDGLAPEWTIPIGAALTADGATRAHYAKPPLSSWPLAACSVEWTRPCRKDERLIALSRVTALGRTSMTRMFRVYSYESKEQIIRGESVSVSAGPHGPIPFVPEFFSPEENTSERASIDATPPSAIEGQQLSAPEQPALNNFAASTLQAIVATPKARSLDGKVIVYPIEIPEQGTGVSLAQPLRVIAQAPPVFRTKEISRLVVRTKGKPVAAIEPAPTGSAQIEFLASAREGYELVIEFKQARAESLCPSEYEELWSAAAVAHEEVPEDGRPDIFRFEWPELVNKKLKEPQRLSVGDTWAWLFPADLLHLLTNPIAGGAEPLGRRLHPIASMEIGTAIHAALKACGSGFRPQAADLRCTHPVYGRAPLRLRQQLVAMEGNKLVFANSVTEADMEVAQVRLTVVEQ